MHFFGGYIENGYNFNEIYNFLIEHYYTFIIFF